MADRPRRPKYTKTSSNSSTSVDPKLEDMGKPRPDVSPGGSKETPEKKRSRPKRERWLLTRKTWRYMADAGRRLIPEGLQNRPEDVPRIEAYFQEVCHKEPRFLLWRKQSYPGALGIRHRGRSRGGRKKIGGSCRDKTSSADEAEDIKKGATARLTPQQARKLGSKLDLKKLKEDFLLGISNTSQPQSTVSSPEEESNLLLETLEMYLNEKPSDSKSPSTSRSSFNHEELLEKLREHLDSIERLAAEERARTPRPTSVHFEGDNTQKMLLETLRRYFGKSTNREKVISDILTDRKSLEGLYFDLRKARGFKSGRSSGESVGAGYSATAVRRQWKPRGGERSFLYQDLREEDADEEVGSSDSRQEVTSETSPPPLIQIKPDIEPPVKTFATQTEAIPASVLVAIQDELKRLKLAKEAEQKVEEDKPKPKPYTRRSSVTDNDDVSPSVGDTIKRYLRMARKKSVDSDKADRFKRVNYDQNIRNIRPKGEITQIGDDDGLDKGSQTEESWVVALKELKLEDKLYETTSPTEEHFSSRITSSRSSVDTGVEDLSSPPQTPIPPTKSPSGILQTGQTFLSNLLHQKSRNNSSVSAVPGAMQKSKSTSSVVVKKIWKSRSKSQTRVTSPTSAWTPQGNCQWTNGVGRTVTLSDTTLLQLSSLYWLSCVFQGNCQWTNGVGRTVTLSNTTLLQLSSLYWLSCVFQGNCQWTNGIGRTVTLSDTTLLQLSSLYWLSCVFQGNCQWTNGVGRTVTLSDTTLLQLSSLYWLSCVFQGNCQWTNGIGRTVTLSDTTLLQLSSLYWLSCVFQGNCQWTNGIGRTVTLSDTTLLQLSDIERRVLQKVALAKLQALNLGVAVRIPSDNVSASTVQKPKRRAYLLKRKAITTGLFDTKSGKEDKEKVEGGGLVFGIPLGQCVENERLARSKGDSLLGDDSDLRRKSHHGSRSSFSSLIEHGAKDEKGSSESLMSPTLSMPGLLDSLSVGSALDLSLEQGGVPNIVSSCLRHLENHGLHTLGIFRVSSSKKRVRQLREDFDCGKEMTMEADLCPHDVATLLKEYFRDLPDSLLCKDLYQAFIQTQRIRNRRLQQEALQHLVQLLPVPNRDTLYALLCLLAEVAHNSEDHKDNSGEWVVGNKMDSNNLATLFAPNILHPCKPSGKDELSAERTEERSDAINVIRALIDNYRDLYLVSADLLHEIYVHMMDSHPEFLDQIMQKKDLATEETEDLDNSTVSDERFQISQESLMERKVWSREAFTHETAGMGGPDLEMKPSKKEKERTRERVTKKRWREEQTMTTRRRIDSDQSTPSRRTSSTSHPDESLYIEDPMVVRGKGGERGVITATLKIPVPASTSLTLGLDDSDIPYIEDQDRHHVTVRSSDSSQASTYIHHVAIATDSAVGSSVSPPRNSVSSYSSGGVFSSPPSWASSPPTSPDSTVSPSSYLPEDTPATTARITIPTKRTPDPQQRVTIQRVTIKTAGEVQQVKQTYSRQESSSSLSQTQTQERERRRSKDSPYQRLGVGSGEKLSKSASSTAVTQAVERTIPIVQEVNRDRTSTPSISSIGGAVMRSKTADIERMLKIQTTKQSKKSTSEEDKKIKRKYTDSRHLTRSLPQATETAETATTSTTTTLWKRREIISSEPKERKGLPNKM
ncbi:uncharacterized protein LOC128988541 [Macrosteles quadrilineatus]|uniref:uncharacterized protein LOC128988541 n=1 Tax=Macrosteles quadrilineatus TaxID=74068 RepID=UPI0023E1BBEC|nr:uncharacterized protein LOC128988541 [Macrosteles quadrilineatus]